MKIDIKNLSHTYDVEVLNDINLELNGYKSIAIIGMSGSGKSTLIRMLSGLEKPSIGEININNMNVLDDSYKKKIGFVFQNHNLFPHLTLKRNISLILEKTRGYSKEDAEKVACENLRLVHLEDQVDKIPKNISGGQAQRASIARALSLNPDIIFLDEPTSSLDPILTYEVLQSIIELKELGKEFVLVTHVMSFVRDFSDYVIYMSLGKIVEQGTIDILNNPKTKSLKEFMEKVR